MRKSAGRIAAIAPPALIIAADVALGQMPNEISDWLANHLLPL
jgi:hypothetical protein